MSSTSSLIPCFKLLKRRLNWFSALRSCWTCLERCDCTESTREGGVGDRKLLWNGPTILLLNDDDGSREAEFQGELARSLQPELIWHLFQRNDHCVRRQQYQYQIDLSCQLPTRLWLSTCVSSPKLLLLETSEHTQPPCSNYSHTQELYYEHRRRKAKPTTTRAQLGIDIISFFSSISVLPLSRAKSTLSVFEIKRNL